MTERRLLPENWLFETLTRLEDRMAAHAQENRQHFKELRFAMDAHAAEDRVVEKRVTAIETGIASEREERKRVSQRIGTVAGLIGGAALTLIVDLIKRIAGVK